MHSESGISDFNCAIHIYLNLNQWNIDGCTGLSTKIETVRRSLVKIKSSDLNLVYMVKTERS